MKSELLEEFEMMEGIPAEMFDIKDWNRFDRFCDSREKENEKAYTKDEILKCMHEVEIEEDRDYSKLFKRIQEL